MQLTLATYNIHRCVGRDRKLRPDRIVEVLQELSADVVALQEVESRDHGGLDLLAHFAAETGLVAIAGPNIYKHGTRYGNALLTRLPVMATTRFDLSFRKREPRGGIDVQLRWADQTLHVVATHLGLTAAERRWQMSRVLERFATSRSDAHVLLGDINEWWRWGRVHRWLDAHFPAAATAPATFPAVLPLFALDQIRVRPARLLRELNVHASPMARRASDHLPLTASIARQRAHVQC
ncbi:MAG: endonuclease/exonuclease/phosphatase family protein [Pseudomonadales bacterium]